MPSSLRRTWTLIALALVSILPIAFLSLRDAARDVFPTCHGSLEETSDPYGLDRLTASRRLGDSVLAFDGQWQPGDFALRSDTTAKNGVFQIRISRVETDANGDCACGEGSGFRSTGSWSREGASWTNR